MKNEIVILIKVNGLRPPLHRMAVALWGENIDYDSDGNSKTPDDTEWTELTIENRMKKGQRVDIDPVSLNPLVLKVRSENKILAQQVAEYLRRETKGEMLSVG